MLNPPAANFVGGTGRVGLASFKALYLSSPDQDQGTLMHAMEGLVAHRSMLWQGSFGADAEFWNLLAVHAWTVM